MRDFIEDGYIFIRKIDDGEYYAVSKDVTGTDCYGIPKAEDPTCAYSYDQAESYWNDNPDKRYEIEPEPEPTIQELIQAEVFHLKQYLADTDYAVIKCYDRGLSFAAEYPELYVSRQQARDRINEIENGEDS